jgi:hypothetical protein
MALAYDIIRSAALDVIAGKVQKPVGIEFTNQDELQIGTRLALEEKGLLPRELRLWYEPPLSPEDHRTFLDVFEGLKRDKVILLDDDHDRFTTAILSAPFSQTWQFDSELSGGGQSRTIKVRRKSDGLVGVLKLPTHLDEVGKERFRRETGILSEFNHPSVVKLIESNADFAKGTLGYVTPFGIPLDKYWKEFATNATPKERYDRAYSILNELCLGLAVLHERAVVHRDIKPENIIMLDGRPVLIDFGVAARPEDNRLSVIEGRVVANNFATPPAAHYGLAPIHPSWDSLGLAWVYGFLLGPEPQPKQFHWRFHVLVPEDRIDRARALLAVCAHESTIPRNAAEFSKMMDQLCLDQPLREIAPSGEPLLHNAEETYAEILARDLRLAAEEKELVEISVQLFSESLAQLRSELVRKCVGSERLPIVQWDRRFESEDDFPGTPAPQAPMAGIMHQAYHQVAYGFGDTMTSEQCFFYCHCGDRRRFKVTASVIFSRYRREEGLNFGLCLLCVNDFGERQKWHDVAYSLHRDGKFRNVDDEKVETIDDIASRAQQWCHQELHWSQL